MVTTGKGLILLDPGHGGTDPGAISLSPLELHESEINMEIVAKLQDILTVSGYEVHCTRKADVAVPLSQRARLTAQLNPDIFISVHCNASDNKSANGTETLYRDDNDIELATCIQDELVRALGTKNRGVRNDVTYLKKRLAVLNTLPIPSCLVEVAFISNSADAVILLDTYLIAKAISAGVDQWFISRNIV